MKAFVILLIAAALLVLGGSPSAADGTKIIIDPRRSQYGLRDTVLSAVGARLLDLSVDPTGVHILGVDPRPLRPERVLGGRPLRAADDPDGLLPAYLDQRLLGSLMH